MLKLILIFRSVLQPPSISSADNSFSSVETTIYLFFKYYSVESRLVQIYLLKKELCMSYLVFLCKSNRKSIDTGLIMQKSFIAKKLDIKGEDLLLMIPELYTSVASCFAMKVVTKNMTLF